MKKLLILLMLFAFPAAAQEKYFKTVDKPVVCMSTANYKIIIEKENLVPIALGLVNETMMMELYVNLEKREFNVVEHGAEDFSCIISMGSFFDAQFKILMQEPEQG